MLAVLFALCALKGQNQSDWTEQTFTGGITLSAPVTLEIQPSNVSDPDIARTDMWQGTKGKCLFLVSTTDIKKGSKISTAMALTGVITGLFRKPGIQIQSEKDVLLQGWQGLAVTGGKEGGRVVAIRVYRCADLIVTAGAAYPSTAAKPAEVDQFLDSLHLPSDGKSTKPGPEMIRYPLGESGLTALFPREPTLKDKPLGPEGGDHTLHAFLSEYGMRILFVGYIDLSAPPSADDLQKAESLITGPLTKNVNGKVSEPKEATVGADKGFTFEISSKEKYKGTCLVYAHGSQILYQLVLAPESFDTGKLIETFFGSIDFK